MEKYAKTYSTCIGISIMALMLIFSLNSCASKKPKPAAVHNEQKAVNRADTDVQEKVYSLNEIDRYPMAIKVAPPRYPFEAVKEKLQGRVVVGFILTKDAKIKDPYIVDANPPKIFDEAAIDAVLRSQYQPGYKDGKPVNVKVRTPILFQYVDKY